MDDEEVDLYARLNVPRGASPRDIKRAKRRLALRLNPDKLFPRHYSAAERERLRDDFHDQVRWLDWDGWGGEAPARSLGFSLSRFGPSDCTRV